MPHLQPFQLSFRERKGIFERQFFIFSFVRHPFHRALSAYTDKILGNKPQKAEILRDLGRDPKKLDVHVSLDEFIDVITSQYPERLNPHWRPQVLNLAMDLLHYDFVGRVENFQHDFAELQSRLALPAYPLVRRNQKGHKKHHSIALRRQHKSVLWKLYAEDFEFFGYDPQDLQYDD